MLYTKLYFVPLAVTIAEPDKAPDTRLMRAIIKFSEPISTPEHLAKLEKFLSQRLKSIPTQSVVRQSVKVLVLGWPYLIATTTHIPPDFILSDHGNIDDCIIPKWAAISL